MNGGSCLPPAAAPGAGAKGKAAGKYGAAHPLYQARRPAGRKLKKKTSPDLVVKED